MNMLKYFIVAILLAPVVAFAGQTSSRLSVGMRIIADTAATPNNSAARNPSRRYVSRNSRGVRIQTIEF
jgi:hypothetical protein